MTRFVELGEGLLRVGTSRPASQTALHQSSEWASATLLDSDFPLLQPFLLAHLSSKIHSFQRLSKALQATFDR